MLAKSLGNRKIVENRRKIIENRRKSSTFVKILKPRFSQASSKIENFTWKRIYFTSTI